MTGIIEPKGSKTKERKRKPISPTGKIIGIDASNLRAGGGLHHLPQLLEAVGSQPSAYGIQSAIVWCNQKMRDRLPNQSWIEAIQVPELDRGLPVRIAWQQFALPRELKRRGCDVLFSPGGTLPQGRLGVPSVTMSRNMLPFESEEFGRYSILSLDRLRLELLRRSQAKSFQRAGGVIFLTDYARRTIENALGEKFPHSVVIPHGIDRRFFGDSAKRGATPESFSEERPFRVLYVSTVDLYKHQWTVARAAKHVRDQGIPLEVSFVGGSFPEALQKLQSTLIEVDPERKFAKYLGSVEFKTLHALYQAADAFIFASSCENLPNILLEAMASGLPIASSNRGPMPEVLGEAGLYFDPTREEEIAACLVRLAGDSRLRESLASQARARAEQYSWKRCAEATFGFIVDTCDKFEKSGRRGN